MNQNIVTCPKCQNGKLLLKYEAKYIYSYIIDSNAPGTHNKAEFLPFLYDNREQIESDQYIECDECNVRLPFPFSPADNHIITSELERVIGSLVTLN